MKRLALFILPVIVLGVVIALCIGINDRFTLEGIREVTEYLAGDGNIEDPDERLAAMKAKSDDEVYALQTLTTGLEMLRYYDLDSGWYIGQVQNPDATNPLQLFRAGISTEEKTVLLPYSNINVLKSSGDYPKTVAVIEALERFNHDPLPEWVASSWGPNIVDSFVNSLRFVVGIAGVVGNQIVEAFNEVQPYFHAWFYLIGFSAAL